jgi:two-component system, NarL family, nitrate/nitrite response regulator NarL
MKCLLVDDHGLIRDALAMLILQRCPDVPLRFAASLAEAQDALRAEPDIDWVLLDLQLPDSRGVATVSAICDCTHTARVVVLSAEEHAGIAQDCAQAGAVGFIPKRADFSALDAALAAILQPNLSPAPPSQAAEPAEDDMLGLTHRQVDVLRLLIEGKSNKLIARALDLSESTIKTHVQAIFERLGVKTRAQAVVAAAKRGWRLTSDAT